MVNCSHCLRLTSNKRYCSRKCAATVNNKNHPKRQVEKQNKCSGCSKRLSRRKGSRVSSLCKRCKSLDDIHTFGLITLGESIAANNAARHRYASVRHHAKRVAEKLLNLDSSKCNLCGYVKHTELCHVTPIHTFGNDALLKDINSEGNLVYLCPNCHWELDNTAPVKTSLPD